MSEAEKFRQWAEQYKTGVYMQWVNLSFDRIAKEVANKHINEWNELKAKEKFDNSLYGKIANTFKEYQNEFVKRLLEEDDELFVSGKQWPIGTQLKIRLP